MFMHSVLLVLLDWSAVRYIETRHKYMLCKSLVRRLHWVTHTSYKIHIELLLHAREARRNWAYALLAVYAGFREKLVILMKVVKAARRHARRDMCDMQALEQTTLNGLYNQLGAHQRQEHHHGVHKVIHVQRRGELTPIFAENRDRALC